MITLPILIVCIMLFAWKEADDDARAIAESNKTGKPFTHDDPDRYIMGIVITLILSVASLLECVTWWALLYFPITWAVFTISFRFLLNRKREMDWWYISPSNGYDRRFIVASILIGQLDIPKGDRFTIKEIGLIMKYHDALMNATGVHWIDQRDGPDLNLLASWYKKEVHRSGAFAYSFEAAVLALSLITYITKTL